MNSSHNQSRKRMAEVEDASRDAEEQDADSCPQSVDYVLKRQRNNAAVNKTRQKKRIEEVKTDLFATTFNLISLKVETSKRVQELREENSQLERLIL